MRPGAHDRRVVLQTKTVGRGELGGKAETWATVATLYARVVDANGSQLFQAQAIGNKVDRVVTIRYRSGVTADMRVLIEGVASRITWVKELGRKEGLELYCETINA